MWQLWQNFGVPFEYDAYMIDIRAVSQDAFTYIDSIGRQHWADAYVDRQRYDMLTSTQQNALMAS